MKKLVFISVLSVILFSCKKDTESISVDLGYGYFPTDTTLYRIYNVDSIVHDDNDNGLGKIDTFRYQVKEKYSNSYSDLEGRKTFKISRYYRKNETKNWQIKNIWKANLEKNYAEIQEENLRIMKLVFPLKINAEWNGNALNSLEKQNYEYTSLHESYTINNSTFDSTATILQKDESNVIETAYEQEIYAKNVGLIYKEKTFIDIQNDSGIELYISISEYGRE